MKKTVALLLLAGAFVDPTLAQGDRPTSVLPESLRWQTPPQIPALKATWILDGEQRSGAYILRVKLAGGGLIPPHTHPDERNTTVLSGTIYVGFGDLFDARSVVAIPTGAVYVVPANVPHAIWAKDGDAEYQEAGFGQTATTFIQR